MSFIEVVADAVDVVTLCVSLFPGLDGAEFVPVKLNAVIPNPGELALSVTTTFPEPATGDCKYHNPL